VCNDEDMAYRHHEQVCDLIDAKVPNYESVECLNDNLAPIEFIDVSTCDGFPHFLIIAPPRFECWIYGAPVPTMIVRLRFCQACLGVLVAGAGLTPKFARYPRQTKGI
jgi:hypothetical protein